MVRAPQTHRWWPCLLSLVAAQCVGCTLLASYPAESDEVCTGGVDDDLDGAVDCDDPDCDGQCAEQGDACDNGRDDDGDGFTDRDDPRCWPDAPITQTRCRTIEGSTFDLYRNEAAWSADHLYYQEDPRDPARVALGVGGRDWGRIRVVDPVTGTWNGLQIRARVFLGAPPAGFRSSITISLSDFQLLVARRDGEDSGAIGLEDWELFGPSPAVDEWMDVAVDVTEAGAELVAELTITRPGAAPITASYVFPDGWPPAPPLGIDVHFQGVALLDSLTVVRLPYHTCPERDPRFTASHQVAFRGPSELCVLDGGATHRSTDDGVTWTELPPITALANNEPEAMPHGPAWDEASGEYQAAVRNADGDVLIATSPDCHQWTDRGPIAAPGEPGLNFGVLHYFGHLRLESAHGVRHQVWHVQPSGRLEVWTSASGAAGTYERTREADLELGSLYDATVGIHTPITPLDVIAVGDERILVPTSQTRSLTTTLSERLVQFFVVYDDGSFHEIRGLRQEPSHIVGTFDETDIVQASPLLSFDGRWRGHVVVSGFASTIDTSVGVRGGTTLLEVEIAPERAAP